MRKVEVLVNFKRPDGKILLKAGTVCEPVSGEYPDGSIDIGWPWERDDGIMLLEKGHWRWTEDGDSDA